MAETLIGSHPFLHEAVKAAVVVQPVKAPFHFPALSGVSGLTKFHGAHLGPIVGAPDQARVNAALF